MTRISELTVPAVDDAELLQRFVLSRDEAAFSALVARHGPMVLGICRRILHDPSDAEDAFQAAFLLLAMKAKKVREPHLLGNWLFGAATRVAFNARRAAGRRVVREQRLMSVLRRSPVAETNDVDLRIMLDEQISRLPEKLRRVVVCCHMEGLTKREAAKRLDCPDSTVTLRLTQARELLRRRLGGNGAHLSDASLGAILVAAAVPVALSTGTVKAATLAASGKVAVAGAASSKAVALSKSTSNLLLIAKIKVAAGVLIASTLVVTTAAVTQQRAEKPPIAASAPTTRPIATASPPVKQDHIMQLTLAMLLYANRHGLPPDLKALNYGGDDIEYLGQGRVVVSTIRNSGSVAILAQKISPGYDGPIRLGFLDAHLELLPQAMAAEVIDRSRQAIQAAAAGTPFVAKVPTRPARHLQSVELPVLVRDALAQNAAGLDPISLTWKKQGSSTLPPDEAIAKYYIYKGYFNPQVTHVTWQDGKLYDRRDFNSGNYHEDSFDGASLSFTNSGVHPDLWKQTLSDRKNDDPFFILGFMDRAGFHLPSTPTELRSRLAVPEIIQQLKAGATLTAVETASLDGHPMARLTLVGDNPEWEWLHTLPPDRTYIYYLDPSMNYAVRRAEERYDATLLQVTDNEQFQQLGSRGVWLPRKSTSHYYTTQMLSGKYFPEPILAETFEVSDISLKPVDDARFVLQRPAGANVFDQTAQAPVVRETRSAASQGVLADVQSVKPVADGLSRLWIAAVGFVAAACLTVFGVRKYRRESSI